jgi:hypothetical protein
MCGRIIREIQNSGVGSLRGVAKALTARGIKTARGGAWSAVQVADILRRALKAVGGTSEKSGRCDLRVNEYSIRQLCRNAAKIS